MKFCALLLLVASLALAKNPPNFIIVLMDDMGYNDMSVNAKESINNYPNLKIPNFIETPRLDKMAAEGVRFTDFYSAASVCTPSRAALLTGSYPMRTGSNAVTGATNGGGLNPNEITIADLLKRKSYATAAIGKWHLGIRPKFSATAHGFDSYYGIPYSNDMWLNTMLPLSKTVTLREGYTLETIKLAMVNQTAVEKYTQKNQVPLVRNDTIIEYPADQGTLTKRYTDEAIKFVQKNAQEHRPFFLYLPHTMPHVPLFVSEGFKTNPSCASVGGTAGCGLYADVIEEFDYNMGRLLDAVKVAGIDSTTLIIFTSDNGHWSLGPEKQGSGLPFSGAKFSANEGGHREPAIMRWPGTIHQGIVQHSIVSSIDILPTIAAIAGIPLPFGKTIEGKPYAIDGINIFNRLVTSDTVPRGVPFFYQEANAANFVAVRDGKWKFMSGTNALYNLSTDVQEKTDVSASNQAVRADLVKKLAEFNAKMNSEKRSIGDASTPEPIGGCTNPGASNYNSNAMRDDGSCIIIRGCTDSLASNYNKNAIQDDGSCNPTSISPAKGRGSDALIKIQNHARSIVITLAQPARVNVLNIFGQVVYSFDVKGGLTHTIPNQFTPGVYFLKFKIGGNLVSKKVVMY